MLPVKLRQWGVSRFSGTFLIAKEITSGRFLILVHANAHTHNQLHVVATVNTKSSSNSLFADLLGNRVS